MVVSNASPLIALEQIGQLQLIERIFSEIFIPPAVAREVASSVAARSWIATRELRQSVGRQILRMSLGTGESEAIGLALEVSADWIILDERPVRRVAAGLGLPVIGTLGLLLAAKRRGLISRVRPSLDALVDSGSHVAHALQEPVLHDAGEE